MKALRPAAHSGKLVDPAEVVEDFGPWADDVWEAGKAHYGFCAVRDAATLRKIYPPQLPNCVR